MRKVAVIALMIAMTATGLMAVTPYRQQPGQPRMTCAAPDNICACYRYCECEHSLGLQSCENYTDPAAKFDCQFQADEALDSCNHDCNSQFTYWPQYTCLPTNP